jgi:hypothetical protein
MHLSAKQGCSQAVEKVRQRRSRRTLPAHRPAGVHKRGALSSSRRAPHYSSRRGPCSVRARLGAQGWAGENNSLFDQPAGPYHL